MRSLQGKKKQAAIDPAGRFDAVVFIVDDDPAVREYVGWLLRDTGWRTEAYENAEAFLIAYRDPGVACCLISDLYMPGLSGIELQQRLALEGITLPLIMMSGQGEIATAVHAMREGAVDFLEKPFDGETLLDRVRGALLKASEDRRHASRQAGVAEALERLTPRQRAVLDGLIAGKPSKVIAADLGVSPRTVDVHRFRLMRTLGAESLPDLFRRVVLVRGETGAASPELNEPGGSREP